MATRKDSQQDDAPIYISQKFNVSKLTETGLREYCIYGQLKNRTNENVLITDLVFYVTGKSYKTLYYAYVGENDISINAKGDFYFSKTYYQTSGGNFDSVKISLCKINGIDYHLEYSKDGVTFGEDLKEKRNYYAGLGIGVGGILFLIVIVIIIKSFYEKKEVKY